MNTIEALQGTLTVTADAAPARTTLRSVGAVLCGLSRPSSSPQPSIWRFTPPVFFRRTASGCPTRCSCSRSPTASRFNAAGCYVAARLAPARPMRHALALGFLGVALATLGAVMMWELGPAWYSLANIAIALPCAWAGARLRGARS